MFRTAKEIAEESIRIFLTCAVRDPEQAAGPDPGYRCAGSTNQCTGIPGRGASCVHAPAFFLEKNNSPGHQPIITGDSR
jgi:hypothetical protein